MSPSPISKLGLLAAVAHRRARKPPPDLSGHSAIGAGRATTAADPCALDRFGGQIEAKPTRTRDERQRIPAADSLTLGDVFEHQAAQLSTMAENAGQLAARGHPGLALGAALDVQMMSRRLIEIARRLAEDAP